MFELSKMNRDILFKTWSKKIPGVVLCLLFTLFAVVNCGDLDATDENILPDAVKQKNSAVDLRIYHALHDRQESSAFFGDILPEMKRFLTHWQGFGIRPLSGPVRVYLEPADNVPRWQALTRLYGVGFFVDLFWFQNAVKQAKSFDEIAQPLKTFGCKYPPLLVKYLLRTVPDENWPKFQQKLLDRLAAITDPQLPIPGYKDAFYGALGPQCQFVGLGRSPDLRLRNHMFLTKDIVLHELGHALHEGVWQNLGGTNVKERSPMLSEVLADVFAHTYLKTTCHAPRRENWGSIMQCGRTMDKHEQPLVESVLFDRTDHIGGQPIRHFLWQLFQESPPEAFYTNLAQTVAKVWPTIREYFEKTSLEQQDSIISDNFIEYHDTYMLNFRTLELFAGKMCERLANAPVCGQLEEFLGQEPEDLLNGLSTNAPSRLQGQELSRMVDEKPVTFSFIFDPQAKEWRMRLREGDRLSIFSENGMILSSTFPYSFSMQFYDSASRRFANWSALGELTFQ